VRAMRKGWLKSKRQKAAATEPPVYLLWGDEEGVDGAGRSASGLTYIPPAKPKLPGHEESYNPPKEYLPTEVSWGAGGHGVGQEGRVHGLEQTPPRHSVSNL
jgi:hypothetical protein